MYMYILVGVNVSVIMCILVRIHVYTCMCSSAHSCGCVANGGDAMAAFSLLERESPLRRGTVFPSGRIYFYSEGQE